jgi:hypothetical protein
VEVDYAELLPSLFELQAATKFTPPFVEQKLAKAAGLQRREHAARLSGDTLPLEGVGKVELTALPFGRRYVSTSANFAGSLSLIERLARPES